MKKPIVTKKWETIVVTMNNAVIDADFNYIDGTYYMSSPHQDSNVTFKSDDGGTIQDHIDRAKCVIAALEHIKEQLKL
jgi:hypothetical protein